MIDETRLRETAEQLFTNGAACFEGQDGKRILVTHTSLAGLSTGEFILAYEDKATVFFRSDRPMNRFRLVEAGFSLLIAADLAMVINDLLTVLKQVAHEAKQEALVAHGDTT